MPTTNFDFVHIGAIRVNPNTFSSVVHMDDSRNNVEKDKRAVASMVSYRKVFMPDKVNVPEGEFVNVSNESLPLYELPKEFINHRERSKEDYDAMVEYDCDEEDNYWVELANEKRKKRREQALTTETLELVIDRLEKQSIFEVKGSSSGVVAGSSFDSDDVCCICADGDVSNVNQIIYCDMCNIAVHQECYGVPYIPEGQWLCRRCKLSPSAPVSCLLCPNSGGAFKQTSDGRWAHVICAIWLNEVHFGNAVFLEPIEGVDNSLQRRSKLKCIICRHKMGACMQCSTRSCIKAFHVTCAQQAGISMKVEAKHDSTAPDGMDVQRFVYCHLHEDNESEIDQSAASRKKRMDNAIRTARRSMAVSSQNAPAVNMPSISKTSVDRIAADVGFDISDIIQFWYLKRKSRCGVPLIKRLQVVQKVSRVAISQESLTEEEKKLNQRTTVIRNSLEVGRLLCEQIKKREINKKHSLDVSNEMCHLTLMTVDAQMESLMDRIVNKDKNAVFHKPAEVNGYHTVIKHPMDLSTMRKRLNSGKYHSLGDMRTDFLLMTDNCELFNKGNEWYLRYGRRIRKYGLDLIQEAEDRCKAREKLWTGSPDIMSQVHKVMFYDSIRHSDDQEDDYDEPEPVSKAASTPLHRSARKTSDSVNSAQLNNHEKRSSFLTPRELPLRAVRGSSPVSMTPRSHKRKPDLSLLTPGNTVKRKRKEDETPFRQASITKFFAASPVTPIERRSSLRHAAPAPLMAFRDNSVTSPLPADVPSSESSADEDDARPSRRSARLGVNDHAKMEIVEDQQGFPHNDLVSVDGVAGRVIDPREAALEDHLPKALISECRTSSRREGKICVMLFGTENKWGWYPPEDIRSINLDKEVDGVTPASLRPARQWYKKMIDSFK